MTLYLEPWGEQYTMAPEATFTAVARGPEGDTFEVEVSDNHIILYGWPGAVVTLFHEGKEIGTGSPRGPLSRLRPAVPDNGCVPPSTPGVFARAVQRAMPTMLCEPAM